MSFHFYISNNTAITYSTLLSHPRLPANTKISFDINPDDTVSGFSKFYIPKLSSRGVALTVSEKEFDIALNTGASKDDYLLGAKLALALAALNDSDITPEFDDTLSSAEFESQYNEAWAEENYLMGLSALLYMVNKDADGSAMLTGCIRPYYIGHYVQAQLTNDDPEETVLHNRIIEEIKRIQYIEDEVPGIEFPSIMVMDFPKEGLKDKELCVIQPGYTEFLSKVDYVVLNRKDLGIARIPYETFVNQIKHKAKRVDEYQYILNPLSDEEHDEMILRFKETEAKEPAQNEHQENTPELKVGKKPWWQLWK